MLKKSLRLSLFVLVPVIALLFLSSNLASAHGSLLNPLSRIYLCYLENAESPDTLPCQDLVNMSGTQPIYDWTEVNIRDAGANSMSIIPDGRLCSANREKYYGLDQARADWPVTTLPAGGSPYTFRWSVTANHQIASFHFYATKDGYNPNNPLKWSDLEKFATFTNPTLDTVAGLEYPVYQFSTNLPNRTGRHLIYMIWERHDSLEDFYSCSDVWFGSSAQPTPTQAPACTSPAWIAGSYPAGAAVSHNNKEWVARWGNAEAPSTAPLSAPWKIVSNCVSGGSGPTSTAAPTRTNTPVGPTATRTNTPAGPTATASRTATRTNTPSGPTLTPTRTATRTNTPSGPTATASRTATRTNTPVGPTATATSSGTGGTCSPVSATIAAPFTYDGAGTFCWQSTNLGGYINSWNAGSVTLNGTNITNVYVASGSYPAKIGGFWYVTYNSTVAYGHFEAK